ncbi:MAG: transcription antitermination factor NusB [Candidatus Syntrophonatronum acetioxidans]|uniref:Transcription antitermination protein NusB n=1 Tax=Candidatus Syntrophonatronum acetioxidans TaxID=1795816 RepID=A0A424YJ49_9FIRM|nr:MAG: transcription antitermination factor NusB [Candidatus Syntrophonatronum acetioxidans]
MGRRLAREIAFKVLFKIDVGSNDPDFALKYSLEGEDLSRKNRDYVTRLVKGFLKNKEEIDGLIREYLHGWEFERLSGVVRNLLRLSLYEIKYMEDIPSKVSINEALELAKVFDGEDSARFINGILDKAVKK